jgi:hypothetical protein
MHRLDPAKGDIPSTFDADANFIFDKAFDWSGEKAKFAGWLRQISTQVLAKKLTVVAPGSLRRRRAETTRVDSSED